MGYDNPINGVYNYNTEYDFGSGTPADIMLIAGPAGYKGHLKDIAVYVSETFACDTTAAAVLVGSPTDADAYGKLNIPDTTAINTVANSTDDSDAVISSAIAAEAPIQVSVTNSADSGTAAGKGYVTVYIDWYK